MSVDFHQTRCALTLWRSGLGLLIRKFRQFVRVVCPRYVCIYHFLTWVSMAFHQTWCVHWFCEDLVWDYWWENFVNFWQSYLPATRPNFHFWTITLVNINAFSPNLVCALILWRSALGLLMGKFRRFLTELSARNPSVSYFQDNNSSKSQWIFTKFDMCIYIVEICFGIAHWQISSIFDRVICPRRDNGGVLSFHVLFYMIYYYLLTDWLISC